VSSYTKSLLPRYLTDRLWFSHQIYNLCAVGDKDELIRFYGQTPKVKVTARPHVVK